ETPTQLLTYTNSTITWLRGGTSPELSFVTFEHSIDRTNWTFLGHGVRLFQESKSVGWQLTPPSPLFGGTIRARGYFINASSSLVESYFTFEQGPPQLVMKAMGGAFEFRWPASASAYILESSPSLSPTAS